MHIEYLSPEVQPDAPQCIVCNCQHSTQYLHVKAKDFVFNQKNIENTAIKCAECGTLNWLERKMIGYVHQDDFITSRYEIHTRHYCLIGAGIDLGIRLLSQVDNNSKNTMLEVGCGYGFTSHYWQEYKKKTVTALELADYGKRGKHTLGVDIQEKYLHPDDVSIGQFDIVYSSEVIEHVQDPRGFLRALKKNLSENGILILTTPDAEFIKPENDEVQVVAALSPGAHEFVTTKSGIEILFDSVSFSDYLVEIHEERIVAYAVKNGKVSSHFTNKNTDWNNYYGYLTLLCTLEDISVKEGAYYRLFKELVNRANYNEARAVLAKLSPLIKQQYKFDLNLLLLGNGLGSAKFVLEDFVINLPPYIGPLLYYMGIMYSHQQAHLHTKLTLFSLSNQLLLNTIESSTEFSQEARSLVNTCELHFRLALIDLVSYEHNLAIGKSSNSLGKFTSEEHQKRYELKLEQLKKIIF